MKKESINDWLRGDGQTEATTFGIEFIVFEAHPLSRDLESKSNFHEIFVGKVVRGFVNAYGFLVAL